MTNDKSFIEDENEASNDALSGLLQGENSTEKQKVPKDVKVTKDKSGISEPVTAAGGKATVPNETVESVTPKKASAKKGSAKKVSAVPVSESDSAAAVPYASKATGKEKKSAASTNKAANQNPENVSGNIVENVFNIKEVQPSQASVDVEVDNVFKIKDIKQRKPVSDIAKSSTAKSAPKQARAKLPTGKKSKAPIPAGTKPEDGMQGNTDNQVEVLSSIAREVPDNVFKITQIEQGELSASLPIADELPGVPTSSVRLKKITFQLKFHTHIGQLVYVTGNHAVLGNNDFSQGFALTYLNDEYWVGTLTLPDNETLQTDLNYQYYLKENGAFISEWGQDKVIQPATLQAEEILLIDSWNPASLIENTFYTEPFQQVLLKRDFTERNDMVPEIVTHTFKVKAPLLGSDQALCITGSIAELGGWSYSAPIFLSRKAGEVWHSIDLDLSEANFPLSYKYALYDKTTQRVTTFETGENRTVYDSYSAGKHVVVSDGFAQLPFTPFKGAGVAIPVFSLRSQQSFGVGEFTDLKLMIDWAKQARFKIGAIVTC